MMTTIEEVQRVVYEAVDDVNEILPEGRRVVKDPGTPILGPDCVMDSLGFVNFIVIVEDRVQAQFAVSVALADELTRSDGALHTLRALIAYVHRCIEDGTHG